MNILDPIKKQKKLQAIIDDLFHLDSPKIEENRKPQIAEFITSSVNGDEPKAHLVINLNLSENKKGSMVYILTNLRVIKIEIDEKEILSSTYPLNTIIGIDRQLIDDGQRATFSITFQNGGFGLKYSPADIKITGFFQQIEQARS